MNLSLKSTIIRPEKDKINSVIILLHGYGGDGKDISMLSLNWKRFLPNTIFFCPNGHEKCQINPNGYQWFDLSNDDPKYILNESLNAEKILNNYINEIKYELGIKNSQICLSGFSQGCMMSINLGLTSNEKYNCVVGFSGKIIDQKNLSERITSKTNTLLIHGDQDQIVPPTNLLNSKDFLLRHKINVQTKMIKNCDHHIPIEASSLALKFIKDNLKI
tara:strand:- start:710 stop:1363 length:654 start_codon:yes stop_codon:yes gene_type:complete